MVLRYRRYRAFLLFTAIALFFAYSYFQGGSEWQPPSIARPAFDRLGLTGHKPAEWTLKHDDVAARDPEPVLPVEEKPLVLSEVQDHTNTQSPGSQESEPQRVKPALGSADDKLDSQPPPPASGLKHETQSKADPASSQTGGTGQDSLKPHGTIPVHGSSGGKIVYAPIYEHRDPNRIDKAFLPAIDPSNVPHWTKNEHFPIAKTRAYPTATAKAIPKIQARFSKETEEEKEDRMAKLASITSVARKSWDGYKKFAWGHDEVRPATGGYKDPFGGWSATLVDSLDTLYLLGFDDDFEEALEFVEKIDFTTSIKEDIALFEVTIRYLGGMLGAYDLSGGKHRILLDKAVELADVLMGSFDTPNRMPITFYNWSPEDTAVPRRAGTEVVLAELGTLSLEFSRLAQLTKEPKYYDAIDRITDALVEWQNRENGTNAPGLFPVQIDLSPCDFSGTSVPHAVRLSSQNRHKEAPLKIPGPGDVKASHVKRQAGEGLDLTSDALGAPNTGEGAPVATEDAAPFMEHRPSPSISAPADCKPQKLSSFVKNGRDRFTFNGMADSLYEYFPKTYLLLGGVEDKYRGLYVMSIEEASQKLLFRPMIPNMDDILFAGDWYAWKDEKTGELHGFTDAQTSHLSCFIGGMYGMASKIFDRPGDMEYARKLTEGCVWAYNSTQTGIMPEGFQMYGCADRKDCVWNETIYWDQLDPGREAREQMEKHYKEQQAIRKQNEASALAASVSASSGLSGSRSNDLSSSKSVADDEQGDSLSAKSSDRQKSSDSKLLKRQAGSKSSKASKLSSSQDVDDEDVEGDTSDKAHSAGEPATYGMDASSGVAKDSSTSDSASSAGSSQDDTTYDFPALADVNAQFPPPPSSISTSNVPGFIFPGSAMQEQREEHFPTQAEIVKQRIDNERLPGGYVRIHGRSYLLRPEAIESVWYMYRMTGEAHWREVGWRMWEAVSTHTKAAYGNSAIDDVTRDEPTRLDQQESFWMAETVKYFFLLFSDEDVVNLDEWVLNTEAHPFKRPVAGKVPQPAPDHHLAKDSSSSSTASSPAKGAKAPKAKAVKVA